MEKSSVKGAPQRGPGDRPFVDLEASLERSGRIEELIRLYETRVQELAAPVEAGRLLTRAAELARDRIKNAARAEELFRRALLYAPDAKEPLKGLRALFEQRQDHAALAEVLENLARSASGPEKAALLLKAADLYEHKLHRNDRATLCCQRASKADPTSRPSHRRCRLLFLSDHRYLSAFESLERERATLGDASMAEDYASLAEQLAEDPTEHPLALKAGEVALLLQPGNARAEKVQKSIQLFEHTWRDRVRLLRTNSLEERDRKRAARLSLLVAKLFAWFEPKAVAKVTEALDRSFLLWPGMPEGLTFLERLAERTGDFSGAVSWMERMASEGKDRAVQADLWVRTGGLKLMKLQDRPGALAAFENALQADPARTDAACLAAELLIESGRPRDALALCDRSLAAVKDRPGQIGLRIRLGDLSLALGQAESARGYFEQALKLDPSNAQAAYRLARIYVEAGDVEPLGRVTELALHAERPVPERIALGTAIASLFHSKGNPSAAFSALAQSALLEPSRLQLTSNLIESAGKSDGAPEIAAGLRRVAELVPEPASTELWRALAHLLQRSSSDPAEVEAVWKEVLQREPRDSAAMEAIRSLQLGARAPNGATNGSVPPERRIEFPASGSRPHGAKENPESEDAQSLARLLRSALAASRWEEARAILEKLVQISPEPAQRREAQLQLAQLRCEHLNDKDRSAAEYLALLAEGAPAPGVMAGLERLALQGIRPSEIGGALAAQYEKTGDHQRRAASLLAQLSASQDEGEREDLLRTLAGIHDKNLADSRGAFDFVLRALAIDPLDAPLQADALRLAADLSAQLELSRFLTHLDGKIADPRAASELLQLAAQLAEEGGMANEAVGALHDALERSPDEPALLSRLAQLYRRAGRLAECDQTLRRRILVAEEAEKALLYVQLADLSAELSRPREAAQALQEAIKAGADEAKHLSRLCDFLEEAGRMSELSIALNRRIELAAAAGDKDAASRLNLKRARVLEASLDDRSEAVKNYSDILRSRPSDPDALTALEAFLRDGACREEAARALVPAYEALRDHRKLVAVLDVIAETARDGLEKVLALKQAAYIYLQQLRQPDLAFAALARALHLSPSDAGIRNAARQAAEDADALDSFAEVLTDLLGEVSGGARFALHRELAELYEKKLDDRKLAIAHLKQALGIEPRNIEALRMLQRLNRISEDWSALAEVLEVLAEAIPESAETTSLLREAAALREQKLNDPEGAAATWRRIAERDPLDREAASMLDRLYLELDRPQDHAFALGLRRTQEGHSPQGRELAYRLAQSRQKRGDTAGALQLYQEILGQDGSHAGARAALESWVNAPAPQSAAALEILDPVLAQSGEHARRVSLREVRMKSALPQEKARLAAEVRAIYERDMAQPDLAFRAALKAFAAGFDREAARLDAERLGRLSGSYEDLAEAYESAAAALLPGDEAAPALLRRAAALREQLGQGEHAIRLWKDLLSEDPQDRDALDHLSKLYERSKNAKSLSEVFARKAQLAQDPEERHSLLLRAGEAFESAGEESAAIEAFRSALAVRKSPPVLQALDRLYGGAQRAAEQADVLAQLAELSPDAAGKKPILARRAQLLEKQGQDASALAAYAQLLDLSPGDPASIAGLERLLQIESVKLEAARLLEPIFRSVKDYKKLVDVLELRLAAAEPDQRLERINELANLRELLGQKSLAFLARARAFEENPQIETAREELERLAAETGSFPEVAAAYEHSLEQGVSDAAALDLWRRLAIIYSDRLSQSDRAVRAWEEVANRDPDPGQAYQSLARLFRQNKFWKELAGVIQRQIALETAPAKQIHLLFELGHLAEESLSDRKLAASCYQQILERKPDESNAIRFLERVFSQSESWPELAGLIEKEIQLAEQCGAEEEAFDLRVRLGRLKLGHLEDPRGALELFQDVLRWRADHAGAVGALEEMARSDNPLRGDAALALEPVFAGAGDHVKVVQMLESRASAEPVPKARAALLRKVSDVYAGPMANPEMAFLAAARALRELPDDQQSLDLCLQLVEPADASDDLCSLLAEIASKAGDDAARAALYRSLARLQTRQQQLDRGVDSWKRVLEIHAADEEALDAIARLYAKLGRGPDLLEVLRRQLATAEDPTRRSLLLLQIGTLQDEHLKDSQGALATFRRLLELRPEDPQALERLDLLCQKQQRWPELADVLSKRLRLSGAEPSVDLAFRLAHLRESRLMDKLGALELYTQILTANPAHADTLERMNALVRREPQNQAAVNVLLGALRATGDASKLAEVIELRAGVSPDPAERKLLFVELAGLRDVKGESELTYLALYRAFREDPNDADLRRRLEQAVDVAGMHEELSDAYQDQLPRIAEAADAAEVCFTLGILHEEKLNDPERAALFYEKARDFDARISPRALPALDRLYTQQGKAAELTGVIELLVERASEPQAKIALLFRLGQLFQERLEAPERAVAAYERVLGVEKGHLGAARQLEQLYEAAGNTDRLYAMLKLQRETANGGERERILSKMAQVSAEGLSDIDQSIDLYRELLAKNPRNERAYASLEELLEKAERFEELKELLAGRVRQAIEPREVVRANDKLGRALHRSLSRPEEAIPYFKAALERDPRHRLALESLRDIYEELGRKEDLVAILRRLSPLQEDVDGVKALRIRLAEVLAELGRREEALDAGRRALEVEPHRAVDLNRLRQVFAALKAYGDAVNALQLRADLELLSEEREQALATLFEVADVWKGPANKPESAAPALQKLLELDPANRTAYERAKELFAHLNDWRSYAQLVDRYVSQVVTDEERIALLRDLASVREHKLGQKDGAFLAACRALQLQPADDSIRDEVERLADETGSYDELAAVYEQVAEELPYSPLAERIYLVLARVQDQKVDDPEAAEASLRRILEFDPTNAVALDALAEMFSRRGRDAEYIVALEQKLEAASSIEARKQILCEISRTYDERLSNPGESGGALLRALDLEPDLETFRLLSALYRRQKAWVDVAHTLVRSRDLAAAPEDRARVQVEVAQVYDRELGDEVRAAAAYREALDFDPANRDALEALEHIYTKMDRPAELLNIYERQMELASDYRDRVKILFRSAALWEDKFQNLGNADGCIEELLQIDPQNLQAIRALERLRRTQGRWEDLVKVIDRHIQQSTSSEEQSDLCVEIGDVFHQHLKAVDKAVHQYDRALELNPANLRAMHALGTLYERSGNWPFAVEMLQREAQVLGPSQESVELHHRMGKISEDMLQDAATAKACYLEALGISPGYLPALRALKGMYESENDWEAYERTLVAEAEYTEEPEAKSAALCEAAAYFADRKEDLEGAARWYEEALRLLPGSFQAARKLSDIYVGRENWEGSARMLDIVTSCMLETESANRDDDTSRELCRQLYRLGYVAEKLGNREKALGAYEKAYRLDATYLPALEGLGNLLVHAKRLEEAQKVYQTILIHHREDLTDLEVVEIYWQLGEIHGALDQRDRAQNHFEKALSIDPGHEPSLRALVALSDAAAVFDKSAEHRQNLIRVLEGDARFDVCMELGTLAREKLSDSHMAIDAYLAAHKINPESLPVMDALYMLYRETKQPQRAAEILERMLASTSLRQEPEKAKRVYFALGEIACQELGEADRAAAAFNAALDLDHRFVEAFSALEALLAGQKQWKALEENYVRMIQRLPKTEETHVARMALWRGLGDLYLRVLKNSDSALMAYQVVAAGSLDDALVQETYAELAAQKPGSEEKAINAYRRALPTTAQPGKVLSALAELAARRRDYDSAYLAAQAVQGLLGEGGAGEREILTKLTPYARKRELAQHALNDRLWKAHLFHPKVRGPIGEMMAILHEQAGQPYSVPLAQYQINPKKHRIDVPSAQEYQIHHYRYVARLLGMETLELYSPFLVATRDRLNKRSNDPAPDPLVGIEICHTHPVCLRVGGKFFSEPGQKEIYYMLGRTLALLRPELALSQRLSPARLEALFQAAISLSVSSFAFTADPRALQAERDLLARNLSEPARVALDRATREYIRGAKPTDVHDFLEGAELTGLRAGLFVTGDVEPVKKMVMGETGAAYRVEGSAKMRHLMVFAVSEDLHALRAAVGTQVEIQIRK